jgi:serine protease Do
LEGSFADDIGVQEKDVIVSINRHPVTSVEDVRKLQSTMKPGDAVAFRVLRGFPTPGRNGRTSIEYQGIWLAGTLSAAQ